MGNYISLFLNTLVHLGYLAKEDASKLYEELAHTNLPDDFESSYHQVEDIFAKLELKASPKK